MMRWRFTSIQAVVGLLFVAPATLFAAHATVASLDQVRRAAPELPLSASARPDSARPAVPRSAMAGVTGTIDLPPLPDGVAINTAGVRDASVRAASPFLLAGSPADQARALHCLTAAIYYEAASEPIDGQRAIAQVVLNRLRHPAFPATVCGVVFQGSQNRVCQFSFTCDGALARRPEPAAWARAQHVAAAALSGAVFAPVGMATHYHTYAVTPSWNRSLVMTGVFGAHFFHRWKGYWGTPAAFIDRYRGGEPEVQGRVVTADASGRRAAAGQGAGAEGAAGAALWAAPTAAVTPPAGGAEPTDRLPQSQVREEWRDSGRPLI